MLRQIAVIEMRRESVLVKGSRTPAVAGRWPWAVAAGAGKASGEEAAESQARRRGGLGTRGLFRPAPIVGGWCGRRKAAGDGSGIGAPTRAAFGHSGCLDRWPLAHGRRAEFRGPWQRALRVQALTRR